MQTLRGKDRASRPFFFALLGLLCISIGGASVVAPQGGDVLAWIVVGAIFVALGVFGLSVSERLPATLELDGERLRLRFFFGLLSKEIRARTAPDVGRLVERRPSAVFGAASDGPGEDSTFGRYVCLADGPRSLVVGTRGKTGFRKEWTGWRGASSRRAWDVTLDGESMIALDEHLGALGLIQRRTK